MKKEIYKNKLKDIGSSILDDLEPVIKKSGEKVLDFGKEVLNDIITEVFRKRKEGKNEKK